VHTFDVDSHRYTGTHYFEGASLLARSREFVFLGLRDLNDLLNGQVLSGGIPRTVALLLTERLEHGVRGFVAG